MVCRPASRTMPCRWSPTGDRRQHPTPVRKFWESFPRAWPASRTMEPRPERPEKEERMNSTTDLSMVPTTLEFQQIKARLHREVLDRLNLESLQQMDRET